MKHLYPDYYKDFRCIANRCPDSCCKDWDVVVDEDSERFYNSVKSPIGDRLRELTVTDGDGDRVFVSQNGRCPFWNSDMLCDIYIGLGEERLCRTCREFPRITQDYTAFCEHTLSFACPEAARLILENEDSYSGFYAEEPDFSDCGYSAELMRLLLRSRRATAELLSDSKIKFSDRIKNALLYNSSVDDLIWNGEYGAEPAMPKNISSQENKIGFEFIFDLHGRLEWMDRDFKNLIIKAGGSGAPFSPSEELDGAFERFALYLVYRRYLNAIASEDVLFVIKLIAFAYVAVGKAAALIEAEGADITHLLQRYSKEVEHSYENMELLEEEFLENYSFSVEKLLAIL